MQKLIFLCSLCTVLAACSTAPQTQEVASTPQCKEEEAVVGSNIRRARACDKKEEQSPEAAQQQLRDLREQQAAQIRAATPPKPAQ